MSDNQVFQPSAAAKARTLTTKAQYEEMYARSIKDPDGFWAEQAKRLDWFKFPTKIKNTSFEYPNISIKWFEDGELTVAADSTTWATQLRLLSSTLVRRLNEELGHGTVRRVKVVGPASGPRRTGAWRVR